MLKLMCPVSKIGDIKTYVRFGVKEIYVGVECEEFNMKNVSFTGRTKRIEGHENTMLTNFSELEQLVYLAHKNSIKVSFTANVRILSEDLKAEYIKYVNRAIECGVDSIIVGSIYGLILLHDRIDLPIYVGTFFYPFNKYIIDFMNTFNVKRIILPTALSIGEIKNMVDYIKYKQYDIEIEVFCHFGCSNINGRCNLNMYMNPPTFCRGIYNITNEKKEVLKSDSNLIDSAKDCSVCSLKKLNEIGVNSVKILGRGLPIQLVGSLTKVYSEILSEINNKQIYDLRKIAYENIKWWESVYCKSDRCMYLKTKDTRYFV